MNISYPPTSMIRFGNGKSVLNRLQQRKTGIESGKIVPGEEQARRDELKRRFESPDIQNLLNSTIVEQFTGGQLLQALAAVGTYKIKGFSEPSIKEGEFLNAFHPCERAHAAEFLRKIYAIGLTATNAIEDQENGGVFTNLGRYALEQLKKAKRRMSKA